MFTRGSSSYQFCWLTRSKIVIIVNIKFTKNNQPSGSLIQFRTWKWTFSNNWTLRGNKNQTNFMSECVICTVSLFTCPWSRQPQCYIKCGVSAVACFGRRVWKTTRYVILLQIRLFWLIYFLTHRKRIIKTAKYIRRQFSIEGSVRCQVYSMFDKISACVYTVVPYSVKENDGCTT